MAFLNRNSKETSVSVPQEQLELDKKTSYEAYDVWLHRTVSQPAGRMQVTMKSHETRVFVLSSVTD
jgi:hypothetical protein